MEIMPLVAHSRCPGKIILSGEHSTVYGKNSVATTVNLFTETKIYDSDDSTVELILHNFGFKKSWNYSLLKNVPKLIQKSEDFSFNEELISKILKLENDLDTANKNLSNSCLSFLLLYLSIGDLKSERKCFRVEVSSELPNGAGLGSSSSYIVSLAKALFTAYEVSIEKNLFNRWCFEMDKIFHGKPSGVDNTICVYGGAILFGDGKIIEQINHEELPVLQVILVNTKVPRNTKNMVERCRKQLELLPEVGKNLLETLSAVSNQVWKSLKSKNLERFSKLIEINQQLLNCLNVGHEIIDIVVDISWKYGYSAKLTGAGGGGIVMIYIDDPKKKSDLINELLSKELAIYEVKLGVVGVESV